MAVLMNLALVCILGVLQVSSQEKDGLAAQSITYEPQCGKKTTEMLTDHAKCVQILKSDVALKHEVISISKQIFTETDQCCGKQSEEKKCLEEKIKPLMLKLGYVLLGFDQIFGEPLLECIANLSTDAVFSENELDCCCADKKLEPCVPKLEFPTSDFKATIKECKHDAYCSEAFNKALKVIAESLPGLVSGLLLEERVIKDYENLAKYKEQIPKDGKCKEEKGLATLRKELRSFVLTISKYLPLQIELYFQNKRLISAVTTSATKLVSCPIEKQ